MKIDLVRSSSKIYFHGGDVAQLWTSNANYVKYSRYLFKAYDTLSPMLQTQEACKSTVCRHRMSQASNSIQACCRQNLREDSA